LYYNNKKQKIPLIVVVYIPELDCYINYPTKCIYVVDSKNTFSISKKLCYNPRIYHQFNEFIWRDQSIHDNSLLFSEKNNSIKYESNDIINQVTNINNKLNNGLVEVKKENENDKTVNNLNNNLNNDLNNDLNNNLAKENKDIDFFNYVIPEKKLITELIKEEKIINEIEAEVASNNNINNNNIGINNNINGKINYPGTPINMNKTNTPYNSQQSSNQKKNNKSPSNIMPVPNKNQKPKEEKKRKMPADNK